MTPLAPEQALRVALIGHGKVAHTHARAFAALPGASLVAVCGRDRGRAQAFADTYGALVFTDIAEMVRRAAVEVVSICTPHPQHAAQALSAIRAGAHVIVEKPLATRLTDAEAVVAAAARAGVKLGVISQRRLYPSVQRLKRALEAGKLGTPILASVTVLGWRGPEYYAMDPWRGTWDGEGGGVLVNQALHQLDLFGWFMGPVAEVTGYWSNLNHPTIEVEDTAVASVRFANGALGSVLVSNSQNPGLYARVHVHGSNGASVGVQTDGGSSFVAGMTQEVEPPFNDLWTVPGEAERLPAWQARDRALATQIDVMEEFHRRQLQDFLEAVRDDRDPLVTGAEACRVVALIEAIYRAQPGAPPSL